MHEYEAHKKVSLDHSNKTKRNEDRLAKHSGTQEHNRPVEETLQSDRRKAGQDEMERRNREQEWERMNS